jgi:hypothetical protein
MNKFDATDDCFSVSKIPSNLGKEFIKEHHYSKGIHNGPTCYGLFYNKTLIGVCAFANPCSENVRSAVFGIEHKTCVTELHRLAIVDDTPKNTESWFISQVLKLLKKDRPHLCAVLSFADATEGHYGIIYQATNAFYTGSSGKATFYLDQTGRLRHPRQNGKNINKEEALKKQWTPVKREGKHRYLYLLPDNKSHKKNLLKLLKQKILPYPKKTQGTNET